MIAQIVPVKRGAKTLPFFDYAVPDDLKNVLTVGQLVEIPLRKQTEFGLVINITNTTSKPLSNLRPVEKILIDRPLLSEKMIAFINEMSELYSSSFGSLIKTCLPPLKKRKFSKLEKSSTKIISNDLFKKPEFNYYHNAEEKLSKIVQTISADGQNLIIVPELVEAKIMFENLEKIFPGQCALINSDISEKDLYSTWFDIWDDRKTIVVATRIGVFLSFNDLKKIFVIDDFHFGHKSWDSAPRYTSKDAALSLGKHLGAAVVFVTHTPSVEDYYFIKNDVYSVSPPDGLPVFKNPEIINLNSETRAGNFSGISLHLEEAIENAEGNIFIYCNRKGSASYISCRDCSKVERCTNCNLTMTWHEKENRLVCHHCNISRNFDPTCSKCGGVNLSFLGSGAEGITKHLKKLFPDRQKDILSFDKESLDTAKLMNLKNAIIVGTQAVWQHIQWQNLGLIAFIDADTPLFTPEYLSSENLWFSIRDASSKINADCRFILQTRSPDHPIYSSLSEPVVFYTSELDSRRIFDYPPYRFILKIFSSGSTDQEITANSANIYRGLQQLTKTFPDIKITQPLNLFPYFLKNRYRKAIILKLPYRNYKQLLKIITKLLPSSWKTDPNPINLLSI